MFQNITEEMCGNLKDMPKIFCVIKTINKVFVSAMAIPWYDCSLNSINTILKTKIRWTTHCELWIALTWEANWMSGQGLNLHKYFVNLSGLSWRGGGLLPPPPVPSAWNNSANIFGINTFEQLINLGYMHHSNVQFISSFCVC